MYTTYTDLKQESVKLPFTFDKTKLQEDLERLSNIEWTNHFVKRNYEGNWSAIALKAPKGETHPVRMIYSDPSCDTFVDTPFLEQCPYMQEVLNTFQCKLLAVRLMKLAAGSIIKEHRDHGLSPEDGCVRIHVPVITNENMEFYLNGKRIFMKEGECWYLRLSEPHRLANNGQNDRVHIVIDAEMNDWIRDKILEGEEV